MTSAIAASDGQARDIRGYAALDGKDGKFRRPSRGAAHDRQRICAGPVDVHVVA